MCAKVEIIKYMLYVAHTMPYTDEWNELQILFKYNINIQKCRNSFFNFSKLYRCN